jgi:hypothetical protein
MSKKSHQSKAKPIAKKSFRPESLSPKPPMEGTAGARAYVNASNADIRLFAFITNTVLHVDYGAYVARVALDGGEPTIANAGELADREPGQRTKFLRSNRQAFLEMFLSRMVDNFQNYLVDLIREILHSKPTMLSTRQQSLTLEEVLTYDRIEDLVRDVIERKVNSLSYEGFPDLQKWCTDRGIPISVPALRLAEVIELIATRNIIAHNRGIVDERYIRSVRHPSFPLGARRDLSVNYSYEAKNLLDKIVYNTDKSAQKNSPCRRSKSSAVQKHPNPRHEEHTGRRVIHPRSAVTPATKGRAYAIR